MKISKIKLGLMRIDVPNKQDEFIIIPVWDFYGGSIRPSKSNELTEDDKKNLINFHGRSFLTINAIDGSIINRELGH